jgi:glycosyltransferase involved in cell wall biosynthesis
MRWAIIAPFFTGAGPASARPPVWIDDFDQSGRHEYVKLRSISSDEPRSWHTRKQRSTPFAVWIEHWRQARRGLQADCAGLITVFPQLAMMAAIHKCLSPTWRKKPLVAWCFNVGQKPIWPNALMAQMFLRYVDRFVVHSRGEIDTLNRWFGIPKDKIAFVPLQRAPIVLTHREEVETPFVVSMGSANRDYVTLIEAIRGLPVRLVLVASPRSVVDIDIPSNVEVANGLTAEDCRVLAQRARINIVPLADVETASGQVTIVEALRMGRPLVATRGVGSVDYIVDGQNAVLVEARDIAGLRGAIDRLWNDGALREDLSRNALAYAQAHLSDETAATKLAALLDELVAPQHSEP